MTGSNSLLEYLNTRTSAGAEQGRRDGWTASKRMASRRVGCTVLAGTQRRQRAHRNTSCFHARDYGRADYGCCLTMAQVWKFRIFCTVHNVNAHECTNNTTAIRKNSHLLVLRVFDKDSFTLGIPYFCCMQMILQCNDLCGT